MVERPRSQLKKTKTRMESTEDGLEEKVPNAMTKQKRVVPKKRKRYIKDNFLLFQNFFNIFK